MEKKELDKIEPLEIGYRGYFILVVICLLCSCVVIALLMNRIREDHFKIVEYREQLAEENKDCPNNSVPVYLTKEDLARTLFENKLGKEETITEFTITGIDIEDTSKFIGSGEYANNYSNVDEYSVFAIVTYSVKPTSYGKSIMKHNGTVDGDWVRNKKSYIYIRKTAEGYMIDGDGYGTKW